MWFITEGKGIVMLVENRGNLPAGFTVGLTLRLLLLEDQELRIVRSGVFFAMRHGTFKTLKLK
jgi:hypothetical protein